MVLSLFVKKIFRSLRVKAFEAGFIKNMKDCKPGSIAVIQRFGSALNLNLHYHVLVTDGVFALDEKTSSVRFHSLTRPSELELESIAYETCCAVIGRLRREGLWLDESQEEDLFPSINENPLAPSYQASLTGRIEFGEKKGHRLCRIYSEAKCSKDPSKKLIGRGQSFNLDAGRVVQANDRAGLERLARYILRPPISSSRLRERADLQIEVKLKSPWGDGTTHIVLSPMDFIK